MKERVRFAVGAASMVLAACCLMGALFTAWLRCAAGAVTQAAGWAVMQQLDLRNNRGRLVPACRRVVRRTG